jgi:hypothetical protein
MDHMIKIDLQSGFYNFQINRQQQRFYGLYYKGVRYRWTRLPMGHSLAPSIMQRFATDVARQLHLRFQVALVAYLDDWLIFGPQVPADQIVKYLQGIGLTINTSKSVLRPTQQLTYLGLRISIPQQQLTPTRACLQHLQDLSIVPDATRQDL